MTRYSREPEPTIGDEIWEEIQTEIAEGANGTLQAINDGIEYYASEMMYALALTGTLDDMDDSTTASTESGRHQDKSKGRRSKSSPIKKKKEKRYHRTRSEERVVKKKRNLRIKSMLEDLTFRGGEPETAPKKKAETKLKTKKGKKNRESSKEVRESSDDSSKKPVVTAEDIFRPRSELDTSDASLRFRYIAGIKKDGATIDSSGKKIKATAGQETRSLFNADSDERASSEERDATGSTKPAEVSSSAYNEVRDAIEKASTIITENLREDDNELLIIAEICEVQKCLFKLEEERVINSKVQAGVIPPAKGLNRKSDVDRVQEIKSLLERLQDLSARHQILKAKKRAMSKLSGVEPAQEETIVVEEQPKMATVAVAPQTGFGSLFCPGEAEALPKVSNIEVIDLSAYEETW